MTEKPTYELTSYEPVSFTAPEFRISDAAIDFEISNMISAYSEYVSDDGVSADRTVEPGDHIKIALEAVKDGKRMKQLSTEGRVYAVGEGYMPPSFESQIMGMKKGETRQFMFEGPDFDDDYNPITTEIDATVTVLGFLTVKEPRIDDAWVQKNMPVYKGLSELREGISKRLEADGRREYDAYLQQAAVQAAADRFKGHIPDEIYENARDNMVEMLKKNLEQEGRNWEDFLVEQGGEQQFTMMLMLQIRQMLVAGYVLDAFFRHEGMELTDEDIIEACLSMAPGQNPQQVREQVESQPGGKEALQENAERLKANKWLVETANITYVDPDAVANN